ncbi:uncharacterized protein LOC131259645 [Anopheles coustani]|uniref:uncharacterized protein LOC131259645 n=1 Tax=Anopheles coustani TaxID=139045 RepID=UPI00265B54DF|nr:uncharacterized protein LOC131259645 [Anopheles coustani]
MTPEKKRRPVTKVPKGPSSPKSQQDCAAAGSSSENSSGELVIDVQPDPETRIPTISGKESELKNGIPKRVLRRKRRKMSLPCDEEAVFDEKFEETIRKSATKNNLTPICVKKLLKKLVMNDHVFAIVRLKEEEEQEKKRRNSDTNSTEADDGDDEDEDEDERTFPKLTRLKAKQLNQTIFPLVPLNAPATDKEVAALIREDLNSDDDDEEYKPGEDDIPSDDDPNTTISDIDSQPRTPATIVAVSGTDNDAELRYTKDGLFKIPKPRNDSYCSQSEQEQENIALRTRSKLCLTTTDIETLESTFVPPDITTDMYEYDGDMDQAWKDFLEEFTKPLPKDLEEDDDNDPEYVAADMPVPLDAEEMRPVKVSKKELNELVSELMEMSNIDEPYLEQALNETLNESLGCVEYDCRSDMLRTPLPEPSHLQSAPSAAIQSELPAVTEKYPVIMLEDQNQTFDSRPANCDGTLLRTQDMTMVAPDFTSTPIVHRSGVDTVKDTTCEITFRGNDSSTDVMPQTVESSHFGQHISFPSTSTIDQYDRFFIQYSVPEASKPLGSYENWHNYHTVQVPVKLELLDEPVGFNEFQLQLLQQQLRMHVQLTTQHFLQTYAHPLFWESAKTFKDMLVELETVCKPKPNVLPWNLPLALECCQSWEEELASESESNKLYIKYLDESIAHAEKLQLARSKFHQVDFHWRIKEKILTSKAFLYPALIPYKTFRLTLEQCKNGRYTKNEEHLIAFWFQRATEELKEKRNIRRSIKFKDKPTSREVTDYIAKHVGPMYTSAQIKDLIRNRKNIVHPNAIDFFLRYGYSPPFKQVLEYIDFDNVLPLESCQKGLLPANWERYISQVRKKSHTVERKSGRSTGEVKDESCQSSSFAQEAISDDASLQYKLRVLLPQESCESKPEENASSTSPPSLIETHCESVKNSSEEQSQRCDVVTNGCEISCSVVSAEEPNSSENMNNDESWSRSLTSSVASVTDCGCVCHGLKQSVSQIAVHISSDGHLCRGETIDRFNHGDDNGRLTLSPEATRNVSLSARNKDVVKHSVNRLAASATLYVVLKRYLKELKEQCKQELAGGSVFKPSHPIGKVYLHMVQLAVYARFLGGLRKMSENLAAYHHRYSSLQQYNPQRLSGLLQLFHFQETDGSFVVSARYISSSYDYCSMEDKDALFAFNYYEKVEETLLAAGRSDLLERFEEVVKRFNELEDSAPQLYYTVEELLGESFPELVDMFLTFLLPGQAAEVGRFFEHFILTNMNDFLEKLNIFFGKQPSQIKKVHACLNELSNEPNVTIDQVKLKVLPLLKGSTLLTEWFLQLFPTERPPESPLCDYENVTLKKTLNTDSSEPGMVYEQVPYVETVPEGADHAPPHNTIRYIQGRIYQGTLPARLTFLANHCLRLKNDPGATPNGNPESHNLCDEATLKAHAIRLNPLVHCPKGITYADVAHLLLPGGNKDAISGPSASESGNTVDESKGTSSPKKVPPKLPIKKRFNSPTSRKISNSPNDDTNAGKEPQAAASKKTSNVSTTVLPGDSKALSTSKKLKTLIETPSSSREVDQRETVPLTAPPVLSKVEAAQVPHASNGPCTSKERIEPEPPDSQPTTAPEVPSWTREEDEIILLKIIKGYTSVDTFVKMIEQQLPERTNEQIRSRVEFLNEMLQRVNQS